MNEAQIFYNKEDQWQIPIAAGAGQADPMMRHMIMKLPGEEKEEFILMIPFTPRGKDNLSAWMVARNDGEFYGQLVVYRFPKQKLIFGPKQITDRINQDADISRQISLWDQRGSGLSKRHDDNDINLEIYLDDLDKLVNLYVTENYPRVSLLGLGWGAMLATAYVNRNPQMVNGLILSEPFAFTGSHLEAIKDDIFDFSLSSEWYNEYVWSTDVISGDGHEKRDYQFLLKFADSMPNLNEGSDNPRPVWRLGAAANKGIYDSLKGSGDKFSFDFTKNLSQFTEEVLFIRSKENKVLDLEHHERLMQFFTDATLLTINNVGHDLIWLNPGAVLEFVRLYLQNTKP